MQARQRGWLHGRILPRNTRLQRRFRRGQRQCNRKGMKKKQQAATKIEQSHAAEQLVRASRQQTAATKINAASRGKWRAASSEKQTASSKIDHSRGADQLVQRQVQKY